MTNIFASILELVRRNNDIPTFPVEETTPEIDPRLIPITLTRGELDDLYGIVVERDATIEALKAEAARKDNVQRRAIRRLYNLPKILGRVLEASEVSAGIVTSEGCVKTEILGLDGAWLELHVEPFESKVTAVDASGKQEPLAFALRDDGNGDTYASMFRELVGFGNFAKRSPESMPSVLVAEINRQLALANDPAAKRD